MSKGGYHTVLPNAYESKEVFSFTVNSDNSIAKFLSEISSYLTLSLISQTLLALIIVLFIIMLALKVRNWVKTKRLNSYKSVVKKEIKKISKYILFYTLKLNF